MGVTVRSVKVRVGARARARATPENALRLTLNMPAMLPLTKAVVRVSNAEKQAWLDPYYALSEMNVVEIKTVRKIIATMDENVARAKAEFRQYARDINESTGIVTVRTQQLMKEKNWACRFRQWLERSENTTMSTDWFSSSISDSGTDKTH